MNLLLKLPAAPAAAILLVVVVVVAAGFVAVAIVFEAHLSPSQRRARRLPGTPSDTIWATSWNTSSTSSRKLFSYNS